MIPKQLFFIWFGNNKPNYVDFAVNTFKEVNPDFKINLLRYTVDDIENKNNNCQFDVDVYNCVDYILNNDKYRISIRDYRSYGRKFIQILANILRLELISKYGGIYCDCDMFPVKPFDDNLLNRKHFSANCCTSYDNNNRHKDSCFLGSYGHNFYYDNYYACNDNIDINLCPFVDNIDWINRRKLFYDCKLTINDYVDYPYYVEHFVDRTWLNNKTPKCKYDT